jgi:hypothetical protein
VSFTHVRLVPQQDRIIAAVGIERKSQAC